MSTTSADLTSGFKEAVRAIREQRRAIRKVYEAQDTDLQRRERAVEQALEALNRPQFTPAAGKPSRSVSQARLDLVKDFLDEHPESRQSDIAKELDINGGSVHTALMILEEAGKIRRGERVKKDGTVSRMWIKTEDDDDEKAKPKRRAKQKAA